jgi:hypothetical protein
VKFSFEVNLPIRYKAAAAMRGNHVRTSRENDYPVACGCKSDDGPLAEISRSLSQDELQPDVLVH